MNSSYDPQRHEALVGGPWSPDQARDAIARIVSRTRAAASRHGTWAVHPQDGPEGSPPALGLYAGSAGVIWALDELVRSGHAPPGDTFAEYLPRQVVWNREGHMKGGVQARSYLLAQGGLLLALYRTAPSPETADALAAVIADNTDDPNRELIWGAPGTMLAALAMHQATGESRWAELFRAGAQALEHEFLPDPTIDDARIWTQDLYGRPLKYYGLVHGFAGNAFVLTAGRNLLEADSWARWSSRLAQTLRSTAVHEGSHVIWFAGVGPRQPGRLMLAQLCHGSPGMVVGLAALDQPIDDLLVGGAELTWAAGPLAKGAGLCHGTAGNGYAFLKLHARSGDPIWLDRARTFAMHAIVQCETQSGGPRHSLWTGDLGVALYLADCLQGRARFPTLDFS
jgi:hypothetical protein